MWGVTGSEGFWDLVVADPEKQMQGSNWWPPACGKPHGWQPDTEGVGWGAH